MIDLASAGRETLSGSGTNVSLKLQNLIRGSNEGVGAVRKVLCSSGGEVDESCCTTRRRWQTNGLKKKQIQSGEE